MSLKFIITIIKCKKDVYCNLNYDGTVSVTPPALITAICELDAANFPFDEKHCELKWGR